LAQTIPIAGAFVFDPGHGHFHFPMASFGLYNMNPDGTIGGMVAVSPKDGFCIDDSFIYDIYLPNAGAFSNWGACSIPTNLRGLSVGAVDEYDQNDEGQNIPIGNLPDGTYWFRVIVDPNNFLTESDKTNNETDVKLLIAGNTVQVLQTVIPTINPPPSVSLAAPSDGSKVSGTISLIAMTTAGQSVQFLVDGQLVGSPISGAPFSMSWNTASVPDGTHWLAAQTTDSRGYIGTSPVATITISNTGGVDTVPPTVSVTTPEAGSTVSSIVTLAATAADNTSVKSVQFYVDGTALGTPVTTPPYMTTWDTTTATNGAHNLSASAVDSAGLVGTSAPVSVTVNNSHPPKLIGIDVTVSIDGSGTLQTPPLSPATAGDLLVAFVAYDGPSNAPQTASVSGGGLTWTLLKRSNSQSGTAEIWSTRAVGLSSITVLSQPGNGLSNHGSLTVIAFTNASGTGLVNQTAAPSGAPDIYLPGVAAGSWVFAVGNDWDNAIARSPVSGQVLVHQSVDTQAGDTYWVQSTTVPSTAFALVDIHDNAPSSDQWDYAAVEIVAALQ
jgi:Bacterial Ig domain/Lysyl oxidase